MSVAAAASLKRGGSSSSHGNDNVPVLWRPFPSDPNMKLASNTRAGLQRRKAGNKVAPAEAGAGTSPVHGSSKTAATTRGSAHVGRRRQRAKSRSRAGRLSGGARVPQYRENTLRERAVGLVTFWMASVAISFAICAPVLFGLDSHDAYEYTACANVTITCGTMLLGVFYCTNFSGRWGILFTLSLLLMFLTNLAVFAFVPDVIRFHTLAHADTPLHMLNESGALHTALVTRTMELDPASMVEVVVDITDQVGTGAPVNLTACVFPLGDVVNNTVQAWTLCAMINCGYRSCAQMATGNFPDEYNTPSVPGHPFWYELERHTCFLDRVAGAYRYAAMQNVAVSRVPLPEGGFLDQAISAAEAKLGVTSKAAPAVEVFSRAWNDLAPAGRAAFMIRPEMAQTFQLTAAIALAILHVGYCLVGACWVKRGYFGAAELVDEYGKVIGRTNTRARRSTSRVRVSNTTVAVRSSSWHTKGGRTSASVAATTATTSPEGANRGARSPTASGAATHRDEASRASQTSTAPLSVTAVSGASHSPHSIDVSRDDEVKATPDPHPTHY